MLVAVGPAVGERAGWERGRDVDENIEIERKFLVAEIPSAVDLDSGVEITQGYLAVADDTEVRIRRKGVDCTLTVKRGSGLTRAEYEVSIDADQFEKLWPATAGCRVEKTRFDAPLGTLRAELDQYHGELEGLLTVEVEFESVQAAVAFRRPHWFGRDVTGLKQLANKRLAIDGLP